MKRFSALLIISLLAGEMAMADTNQTTQQFKTAVFAGGCFWCMEGPFEKIDGVTAVISGYTGGQKKDPTYEEVSSGATGHTEAVEVTYDPRKTDYRKLLDVFWRSINPTQKDGQFADKGPQYRTGIYYMDDEQKRLAEESKAELAAGGKFKDPIVTEILPAETFYPAEEYHQDYYKKHPVHYKSYRYFSGRTPFLEETWGKEK